MQIERKKKKKSLKRLENNLKRKKKKIQPKLQSGKPWPYLWNANHKLVILFRSRRQILQALLHGTRHVSVFLRNGLVGHLSVGIHWRVRPDR